jgi:hypothetical protein
LIEKYLTKNGITALLQSPYSPDPFTVNYYLFPHVKDHMEGCRFQSVVEVKDAMKAE